MMAIQSLTPSALRAVAQESAQQRIPVEEANHHEPGTAFWVDFNRAYAEALELEAE